MRKCKILITPLVVLLILYALCMPVPAETLPDLTREGSVSVTMRCEGSIVAGGSLNFYSVAGIEEENGQYSFRLNRYFADSRVSLDSLDSSELPEKLAAFAKSKSLAGKVQTIDSSGTVLFEHVKPGLYLIVQNKAAAGYSKAKPFLVTVPAQEKGSYVYDVDASPKVEVKKNTEPTPPEKVPPDLPFTGQLSWPIPVLTVAGLLLFSLGWLLCFGKGRSGHEK